jgi:hypothetical protein
MNNMTDFFTTNLEQSDPEIAKAIHDELFLKRKARC